MRSFEKKRSFKENIRKDTKTKCAFLRKRRNAILDDEEASAPRNPQVLTPQCRLSCFQGVPREGNEGRSSPAKCTLQPQVWRGSASRSQPAQRSHCTPDTRPPTLHCRHRPPPVGLPP